jgi:hypothetical protein
MHKISERIETSRSHDKDALDVYRILRTTEPQDLAERFRSLQQSDLARDVTSSALENFRSLFSSTGARGTQMVIRATSGLEPEEQTARSTVVLAENFLTALRLP